MNSLSKAKWRFRRTFILLAAFSFVVNILMLTMPLYMLQVYDRILPSQSMDTLTFLSVIAFGALVVLGMLEAVRGILAARAAAQLEAGLGADALKAAMLLGQSTGGDIQPVRDLTSIRTYISSRAIFAMLDLPFAPLFIGILYFIHPTLFWLTVAGAVVLLLIAVLNQWVTAKKTAEAGQKQSQALRAAMEMASNDETLRAMGMIDNGINLWGSYNAESMQSQGAVDNRNAMLTGLSRTIRMLLQIAILGVGAWLVLQNQMTAGMIFAASIISGKGLQPLDQVIGTWKQSVVSWRAWKSLQNILSRMPEEKQRTAMPRPKGELSVDGATVVPPRGVAGDPIINRVSFRIKPGEIIGLIGPSGAGKSTLARLLVGAQPPSQGVVRIDGTDIQNWDPVQLGQHVGYLAQEVRLLPGTVKQNIARLAQEPDDAAVLEAARKAQVHELIQSLPRGYDTFVGPGGFVPSVGQRQRIGLARAFFGNPQIMVLDEPNASLDEDGDAALKLAIQEARKAGATVVMATQRKDVLNSVDKILRLHAGNLDFFGTVPEFVQAVKQAREGNPANAGAKQNAGPTSQAPSVSKAQSAAKPAAPQLKPVSSPQGVKKPVATNPFSIDPFQVAASAKKGTAKKPKAKSAARKTGKAGDET